MTDMYESTYDSSIAWLDELKQRVENALLDQPKAKQRGAEITCCSPLRDDDHNPSFSYNSEIGGWIDHGTDEKGNVCELADALGISYQRGYERSPNSGPRTPAPSREETVRAGQALKTMEPPLDWNDPAHQYDYQNTDNTCAFSVLRWEWKTLDWIRKEIRQGRKANGEWVKNLDGVEKPYPLYHAPIIAGLPDGSTVYLVEGEKCAERLTDEGLTATTTVNGAGKSKNTDLTPLYRHHVVIIPDQDKVGEDHANEVATALVGHCPSVKIVELPPMHDKADVVDYLDAGNTIADLDELERQTAPIDPHSPTASCLKRPRLPLITCRELAKRPCKPMEYLIEDRILAAHESTMLFAPPKSFKTFLALEMAVAVATGKPFMGQHTAKQGKVILIDLEDSLDRLRERIEAILGRYGLSFEDIDDELVIYDKASLQDRAFAFDSDAIGQLGDAIKEIKPALVVVDNLRKALPPGVDENSNAHVNPLINLLIAATEQADAALLLVHHTNKGRETFSGAGSLEGTFANTIKVSREPGGDVAKVAPEATRNSEGFEPFGIRMGLDGALQLTDAPSSQDKPMDRTDSKIIDALGNGRMTVIELAARTGIAANTIRNHIKPLLAKGTIEEVDTPPHGAWGQYYALVVDNPFASIEPADDIEEVAI